MGTLNDLLGGMSRGSTASTLGAPVDLAALALNALLAGGGYAGSKLGLLKADQLPDLIHKPALGSDWIADKMRAGGLLNDNPGSTADNWGNVIGGLLGPVAAAKAPQIASGLLQAEQNAVSPRVMGREAGGVLMSLDSITPPKPVSVNVNGINSLLTPRRNILEPSRAIIENRMSSDGGPTLTSINPLRNAPGWNWYPGLTDSGASKINKVRDALLEQKRNYIEDIDVAKYLQRAQPEIQQPQWVNSLVAPSSGRHAGPEWWNSALKNKSNAAFEAFADAAKGSNLMYYGGGSSSNIPAEVARAYPGISAKQSGSDLLFSGKNGGLMVFGADTATPVIRSTMAGSKGKADGGGKELYQAAYNWAANNGKIVVPDTGISDINELRKLGNVLSAQIRTGKPMAELNSGGLLGEQGIPQIWQAEAKMATKRVPDIKDLRFDGKTFNMDNNDIVNLLTKADPSFEKGVGLMTAKRAAIAQWLKTATPTQAKAAATALAAAGSGAVFAKESKD